MPSEDSKPVKKEVGNNNNSSGPKKVTKPQTKVAKVKKEDPQPLITATTASRSKVKKEHNVDYSDDDKPLAKRTSKTKTNTKEVKKKKKIKEEENKKVKGGAEQKKKERKVYDLPGQKRDPPEEKDPLRIFYETLFEQIPTSEMSQIWLMESGLLPKEVAMKVYEKKQKKGLQQKLTSPVKVVGAVKSSTKSVTVKKKCPTSPDPSVKKKTTNSTSKQQPKKRKSECISSDDDSDFDIRSATAKRRKAA